MAKHLRFVLLKGEPFFLEIASAGLAVEGFGDFKMIAPAGEFEAVVTEGGGFLGENVEREIGPLAGEQGDGAGHGRPPYLGWDAVVRLEGIGDLEELVDVGERFVAGIGEADVVGAVDDESAVGGFVGEAVGAGDGVFGVGEQREMEITVEGDRVGGNRRGESAPMARICRPALSNSAKCDIEIGEVGDAAGATVAFIKNDQDGGAAGDVGKIDGWGGIRGVGVLRANSGARSPVLRAGSVRAGRGSSRRLARAGTPMRRGNMSGRMGESANRRRVS